MELDQPTEQTKDRDRQGVGDQPMGGEGDLNRSDRDPEKRPQQTMAEIGAQKASGKWRSLAKNRAITAATAICSGALIRGAGTVKPST